MKKILLSLLSCCLIVGASSSPIFAAKNDEDNLFVKSEYKVVLKNNELKDMNKLFERALKGISDLPDNESLPDIVLPSDSNGISKNSNKELRLKQFKTSQLLEVGEKSDGSKVETYALTVMAAPSDFDHSQYDTKWDSSLGVKAYSTIYVDYYIASNSAKYWDLISAEGGWDVQDSTYSLSNMQVTLGQNGLSTSGQALTQVKPYSPTSRTWSYTAPSSWSPVSASSGTTWYSSACGATSKATVKRSSSSSTLELTNNMK